MQKNQSKISLFIGGTALFALGILFGISGYTAPLGTTSVSAFDATTPEQVDVTPVWKVWNALDEKFVHAKAPGTSDKDVTKQDRIWGMAEGLAASMNDPYTVFLRPETNAMFKSDISGSFSGVGMEIAVRDQVLTVVSPLKDTPSYKAGIKALDRILKIDDVDTKGMSVEAAVKIIRGPKGTAVKLTILREGEPAEKVISVVRDIINVPIIKTKKLPGNVFQIEFLSFSENSPELFKQALVEFQKSGSNKLILDLRGNPGGYLSAAVDAASWFIPSGSVVVTEDYAGKQESIVHRSAGYNVFNDKLQMVILQDKGSASASEILAGALKHYKKGTVIGTKSFGKGSVQELVQITPETSLKVTVARWIMPDGKNIGGEGIDPNIVVEVPKELPKPDKKGVVKDPILDRALLYLKNGK
ncbi:MAG: S41 family peptidase [Minisyncoccia bacterium]